MFMSLYKAWINFSPTAAKPDHFPSVPVALGRLTFSMAFWTSETVSAAESAILEGTLGDVPETLPWVDLWW